MSNQYFVRFGLPTLAAFAVLASVGTASAQTSTVIIAPSAPPAPRIETMPPPSAGSQVMSWQAGHWAWTGAAWSWEEGHYVQAPQPAAVWEPGHWEQQPTGGYVWVDGRWRG
ncbi:MAG: hypothetical protein P4L71_11920 [Acetobacteraceae bacterium]|nr:hypothetical protein [Acetobacteraceae bacterium]